MSPGPKEELVEEQRRDEVSPWEADYQLLVCEGLFSEYLEMGESRRTRLVASAAGLVNRGVFLSDSVRVHHHLRGCVSPRSSLRSR